MNVTFVHCEAYECKNITSKQYKERFGSFCFEHSSKTKGPFHIEASNERVSPVSPRRSPLEVVIQTATSPQRKSATSPRRSTTGSRKSRTPNRLPLPDESEEEYGEVSSFIPEVETYSRSVVSPRKNIDFFPKVNCYFCKNKCPISDIMECGDVFCQDCLNDEGKMNDIHCPNCGELLKGKLITEKMSKILEDRYKRKLQNQELEDYYNEEEEYYNEDNEYNEEYYEE